MPRKKVQEKTIPTHINKPRVIVYDDDNIQYVVGSGACFNWEPQFQSEEFIGGERTYYALNTVMTMSLDDAACLDNIKLDDTLMRRIAEFNKSQECKRLDKEIHDKRQRVDEIEAILEDRERRLVKLKEFVSHIYELDVDDCDEWDD